MTTPEEGMECVDVHKKWKHEALDFTPWLAENLGMLSDALGVRLELDQTEKPVGPFSCDILAREVESGVMVAIENQLETSDHSHLGQLLTYAAGLEARVSVWVAPAFFYEHAEALHRLNEWTGDRHRFLRRQGNGVEYRQLAEVASLPGSDSGRLEQGRHVATGSGGSKQKEVR